MVGALGIRRPNPGRLVSREYASTGVALAIAQSVKSQRLCQRGGEIAVRGLFGWAYGGTVAVSYWDRVSTLSRGWGIMPDSDRLGWWFGHCVGMAIDTTGLRPRSVEVIEKHSTVDGRFDFTVDDCWQALKDLALLALFAESRGDREQVEEIREAAFLVHQSADELMRRWMSDHNLWP